MATGDYIGVQDYKSFRGISDGLDDVEIGRLITVASRVIDNHCGRQFFQDASTSVRHYQPSPGDTLLVDDISTTTGLVVVDFGRTLVLDTDFGLFPTDGFTNSGEAGPYYLLRRFYGVPFFSASKGASVAVTAQWGWATTPPIVKQATSLLVADFIAARNNRFGMVGIDTGVPLRVRMNSEVQALLSSYRRETAPSFGFA